MCNTFAVYFQIFATFGYKKVKNSDLKEQQATARRLSAFKQKHTMEEAFLRSLLLQKEFMLKSLFI